MEPKFKYIFERSYVKAVGNQQWIFRFPNGYGASVIHGKYTYGGDEGLFELAVLGKDGRLDYSTTITDDVVGYLNVQQVDELCERIAQL